MEDFRALISLLTTPRPPLSENEANELDFIVSTISTTLRKDELSRPIEPIKFIWLEPPPAFKFGNPELQLSDDQDSITTLTVTLKQGNNCYSSITEAVANAKDNYKIIIESGNYSEQVSIRKNLHFVGKPDTILEKCRFALTSANVTFKGFSFSCDSETFNLVKSSVSFFGCKINGSGHLPLISIENASKIIFIDCVCSSPFIVNGNNSSIIKALKSSFFGIIRAGRSDVTFDFCQFSNPKGSCIDINSSNLRLTNSKISNCSDFGICGANKSILNVEDAQFELIKGSGIWVQTMSSLNCRQVYIQNCEKAAILLQSNSSGVFLTCSFTHCPNVTCELQSQSNATFNETWISDIGTEGIKGDSRSNITLTRCNITRSKGVGVSLSNTSVLKSNETRYSLCETYTIFLSNSDFFGITNEIIQSKKAGFLLKQQSRIDLTNCNIMKNGTYAVEALEDSKITCNNCFFIENSQYAVQADQCVLCKFISCAICKNVKGGLYIQKSDMVQVDRCKILNNNISLSGIKEGIVRQSLFVSAYNVFQTDQGKEAHHIETLDRSNIIYEDNILNDSILIVKRRCTSTIRRNDITKTKNYAIQIDERCNVKIENNKLNQCNLALLIQDHCVMTFDSNIIENIIFPDKDDPNRVVNKFKDNKRKVLSIKKFSEGSVENNLITGDYDYAIFVDSQSKIFVKSNRLDSGSRGIVLYTGVSSGSCIDNTYSGKFKDSPVDFQVGCIEIRR